MSKYANLKVGITAFIGLIAMGTLVMIVGTQDFLFSKTYDLKIFLNTADGISKGTMVSLGGIKIGTVEDFEITELNGLNGVEITMEILESYKNRITTSTVADIRTSGMLGDKYVELSIGRNGEQPLSEFTFIPVAPIMDLAGMFNSFKSSLNGIGSAFDSFKALADDIRNGGGSAGKLINDDKLYDNLTAVAASTSNFMYMLNNGKGLLGKVIKDDSLYYNVKSTAENLNAFSNNLKNGKGVLSQLINNDSLYNNINALSNRINNVLGKLEKSDNNAGKFLNDEQMYNQVNKLIKDINALIEDINKNPSKYINVSIF